MFSPTFLKILAERSITANLNDMLTERIVSNYGAVFVAQGDIIPPPFAIFPDETEVSEWQAGLKIKGETIDDISIELQSEAMERLLQARAEAQTSGLDITPNHKDSDRRSYAETVVLWKSRVTPGLEHYVRNNLLASSDADYIKNLSPFDQIKEILGLEEKGLYFSKDLSKSILYSVAAPGSSQHISMLALDIRQYNDPTVRQIMARHGWFQTIVSDLPHFTYLGVEEAGLPSLGLKRVTDANRDYWVPDSI
jgi:hypothetical protein